MVPKSKQMVVPTPATFWNCGMARMPFPTFGIKQPNPSLIVSTKKPTLYIQPTNCLYKEKNFVYTITQLSIQRKKLCIYNRPIVYTKKITLYIQSPNCLYKEKNFVYTNLSIQSFFLCIDNLRTQNCIYKKSSY